jgi:hypothetical protein
MVAARLASSTSEPVAHRPPARRRWPPGTAGGSAPRPGDAASSHAPSAAAHRRSAAGWPTPHAGRAPPPAPARGGPAGRRRRPPGCLAPVGVGWLTSRRRVMPLDCASRAAARSWCASRRSRSPPSGDRPSRPPSRRAGLHPGDVADHARVVDDEGDVAGDGDEGLRQLRRKRRQDTQVGCLCRALRCLGHTTSPGQRFACTRDGRAPKTKGNKRSAPYHRGRCRTPSRSTGPADRARLDEELCGR